MMEPSHHYVGKCKSCGVAIAAVYDMPEYAKDTAATIQNMIRRGLTVERMPVGAVALPPLGCQCHRDPAYGLPLFSMEAR